MNFGILVNEGPYQHQASDSAYLFAKAAIDEGHTIFRVFFYHDGVNNGTRLATPPQDDRHIPNRWSELAKENKIDLVLCVAAAQRRGMVDPDEMKRNNKDNLLTLRYNCRKMFFWLEWKHIKVSKISSIYWHNFRSRFISQLSCQIALTSKSLVKIITKITCYCHLIRYEIF